MQPTSMYLLRVGFRKFQVVLFYPASGALVFYPVLRAKTADFLFNGLMEDLGMS